MKPPRDPPRLLDPGSEAPEWLRSSLEAGVRDVPGPERLARIAARLPMGPSGPLPPSAPAAPVPSMLSGAAAGAAIGLALVGAGWLASSRSPSPPPSASPTPVAALVAPATSAVPPRPEVPAPAPRPRVPSDHRLPAVPPPAPATPAPAAASAAPEPSTAAAPIATEPDLPVAESESAILQRAQDALSGSPARALAITDQHLARYPGGELAQEREVIAVSALLGMGRGAEARARAERFLAAYPTSGHRRRLEVLIPDLGSHKEPSDRPSTP